MKNINQITTTISRILLILVNLFLILMLLIARMFEVAGGSSKSHNYLITFLIIVLCFAIYIFANRIKTKEISQPFNFYGETIFCVIFIVLSLISIFLNAFDNSDLKAMIPLLFLIIAPMLILKSNWEEKNK
jgi:NADH:ubiquinone oxidoreductase subunit 2 (subunit N)